MIRLKFRVRNCSLYEPVEGKKDDDSKNEIIDLHKITDRAEGEFIIPEKSGELSDQPEG